MVLANAAHVGQEARQMGVQIAFLYADIEEEVFVEEQPVFKTQDKDVGPLAFKLETSIYGLAQSPGNWFYTTYSVLIAIGLEPLKSNTCMYIYQHSGTIIIFTLYVDDILIIDDRDDQEEEGGQVEDEGHG